MTQNEMFGEAKWIAAEPENIVAAPLFRKCFDIKAGESAVIRIIGLGAFVAYMNGKRISDEYFLPLNSEYEKCDFPVGEELTGFRTYVTEYDVTEYLRTGKNALSVLVGHGWYNGVHYGARISCGEKKLIFALMIKGSTGAVRTVVSDGSEKYIESFVKDGDQNRGEAHDYTDWHGELLSPEIDDDGWGRVRFSKPVETEYLFTDCPADKIIDTLDAACVYECENYRIYDAGANISGYPVLRSVDGVVGESRVIFSEALNADGTDIDESHVFWQHFNVINDGAVREEFPVFTWLGFRYFRVEGAPVDVVCVKLVHAAVDVNSSFESDNAVLNWTYDAFIRTQLTNMHRGIPSDCPHIERLGYTGDGQLCARTAMMTLGAKEFYEKWIMDISDCQDKLTGRVQYTAPYSYCGGGPGGWGAAIVFVPYEYYKAYGDDKYLRKLFPQMLFFFDFLDSKSTAGVVTGFKDGLWCLGDWCTPVAWTLPTPFVNTCFYLICLDRAVEIAKIIGCTEEIPGLEGRIEKCKKAVNTFYFNDFVRDDTYCANTQGAGAFALSAGLGNETTKEKMIGYYETLGYYDTGIFATEMVTRKLFEYGRADVAFKLLTASEPHGFGRWMNIGSTTLREYWGDDCRSFSHPMFGGVVSLFFEYILGIRQAEKSAGYDSVIISPVSIEGLNRASGHITTPHGRIAVSYNKEGEKITYSVELPEGVTAHFEANGKSYPLRAGVNSITV